VYRRRRLVLLLVLIAIVAVVWLLIARPWSSGAAVEPADAQGQDAQPVLPVVSTSPQPGDASSGTPSPTPTATDGATDAATDAASTPPSDATKTPSPGASAAACTPNDVTVQAVTDKTSYASGQDPKLSIELTNESDQPCTLNVGTSAQVFTITSGSDTWWRSTDCQSEPSDMLVVLNAGQKVSSSQPLVWDRTRSSVATCQAKNRPQAAGGGASYHLSVEIGGIDSIDDAIFQLY